MQTNNMPPSKCCMVCGDKALGYNFNAITCESCKAFFRRNALAKKSFSCPFNQNCEITVVTRRFCQKCRLKKCFDIGMKSENIMSEEDKLIKRKKIENNRQAKRKTPSSSSSSGGKVDDESSVLDKIKREDIPDGGGGNSFGSDQYTSHDSQSCNSFESDNLQQSTARSSSCNSLDISHENMTSSQIVDFIVNDPDQASQAISRLMKTPKDAIVTLEKVINAQSDALRLISHLISFPGDALKIISKLMNSPFDALTVFTKFMSSPTDALEIISKIVSSPQDVLQFVKQLMDSPGDALDIMTKFMNTPVEALRMINKMVKSTNKGDEGSTTSSSQVDSQLPEMSTSMSPTTTAEDAIINSMLSTNSCGSNHSSTANSNQEDYFVMTTNDCSELDPSEGATASIPSIPDGEALESPVNMDGSNGEQATKENDKKNSLEAVLYEVIQIEYEMANSIPQTCNFVNRELNEAELQKLNELKLANKALYYPVDEDLSSLIMDDSRIKPEEGQQDPQLLKVINLTAVAIKRLIKMSKKIAAFRNMCQEDQVALLKGGCTEMMIMRSVLSYDGDGDTWKIPHSRGDMSSIKADVLKLAKGNVYEEHERFIRTFDHKWRMDENIILILCAIVLFTPTRARVIHCDVIKLEQNSYYYLLRRYLESVYPGCEAKSTFIKLIQKISDVERLNQVIIGVYLNVNPSQVEPLLREIFDLKNH
ncbi:nuclear hormone receptor HR96 [Episyrphus balteatus]|uniref:nuclear hormone receptor HR96 n=1 Tax=Episyrphus balteatus TaxID=286459 RepID=UPI0024852648|nr:nuclear hormone receptor HR96 [Episyrphus balteatus]